MTNQKRYTWELEESPAMFTSVAVVLKHRRKRSQHVEKDEEKEQELLFQWQLQWQQKLI